ncbi:hypothetical protein [Nocardioides pakistanensis]
MAAPDGSTACWGCATGRAVLRDEFGHTLCAGCARHYEVDLALATGIDSPQPVSRTGASAPSPCRAE